MEINEKKNIEERVKIIFQPQNMFHFYEMLINLNVLVQIN